MGVGIMGVRITVRIGSDVDAETERSWAGQVFSCQVVRADVGQWIDSGRRDDS